MVLPLLIYSAIGIAYVAFIAAFYRSAVDEMAFDELTFTFDADLNDWMVFYLQTALLTIGTLGLAIAFYNYRKWVFFIRRLEVHGAVDFAAMRRTTTKGGGDAEGLADAFEIGAF